MSRFFRIQLSFQVITIFTGVCFSQSADIPDPRALAREFQEAVRGNHQSGGSVVVMERCDAKDIDSKPVLLPSAQTRLMQIDKANPNYLVTNTEVPNFLPKNYEPELLKSRVRQYTLDSNNSPAKALDELLKLEELKAAVTASGLYKGLEIISGAQPPPWQPEPPRRTKLLTSLTLRTVLNEMAAFYGTGIWTYRETNGCNGERLTSIHFTIY
jgi:hypothetical protein